jgi:hypothetical protein
MEIASSQNSFLPYGGGKMEIIFYDDSPSRVCFNEHI